MTGNKQAASDYTSGAISWALSSFVLIWSLRHGLQELTKYLVLAGQWPAGIHLSLPPQYWDYKYTKYVCLVFFFLFNFLFSFF